MEEVASRTKVDERLLRKAVSISKERRPQYSWVRLGEGYSVSLAEELLSGNEGGKVLDPFAGCGTTLLAASHLNMDGVGIEVMPMCSAKFEWLRSWPSLDLESMARQADLMRTMRIFDDIPPEDLPENADCFGLGEMDLVAAMSVRSFLASLPSMPERTLLQAVMLMSLKDRKREAGRFMRMDRKGGLQAKLDVVPRFMDLETAFALNLTKTLIHLVELEDNGGWEALDRQELLTGSALDILPALPDGEFDAVLTSPPYFNGFSYPDEYALEHWFLGLEEDLQQNQGRFLPTGPGVEMSKATSIELERSTAKWRSEGMDLNELLPGDLVEKEEALAFGVYLMDLSRIIQMVSRKVPPGGTVTFVLDDAYVGCADIRMDEVLSVIAAEHPLTLDSVFRYGNGKDASTSRLRAERQRTAIIRWKRK